MRSVLNIRLGGGILVSCMGYTSLKLNASESKEHHGSKNITVKPQIGSWRRWKEESQSLGPFLKGIGAPAIATFFVDAILIRNDLTIQLNEDNILEVTDKTLLGSNVTKVGLGAAEVERSTRTGRKKFMLSAFEAEDDDGSDRITVQCRLFERGPGWYTQQSWIVDKEDVLREQMVLKRAEDSDIIVRRAYKRLSGPELLHKDGELVTKLQDTNNDKWTKTAVSLAGIGTVCLIAWLLGPWKGSSNSRNE